MTAWVGRLPYSKKHFPDADWWWLKIKTTTGGWRVILCARCQAHVLAGPEDPFPRCCGMCGYAPRKVIRYVRDFKTYFGRGSYALLNSYRPQRDITEAAIFDEHDRNQTDPLADENWTEQVW